MYHMSNLFINSHFARHILQYSWLQYIVILIYFLFFINYKISAESSFNALSNFFHIDFAKYVDNFCYKSMLNVISLLKVPQKG